jgi:hypothetical protein
MIRFAIDAQNAIGAIGIAFCLAIGWSAGGWLMGKLLSRL